jgi:hypothetical protein
MQLTFDAMLPTIWVFFKIHYSKYAEQHPHKEHQQNQQHELRALHEELSKLRMLYTEKKIQIRGEAMLYTHTCIETLQQLLVRAEQKEQREGGGGLSVWAQSAGSSTGSGSSISRKEQGRNKARSSSLHALMGGGAWPSTMTLVEQTNEVKRQVTIMREQRTRLRRRHSVEFAEVVDPFDTTEANSTSNGKQRASENDRAGPSVGEGPSSSSRKTRTKTKISTPSILNKLVHHGGAAQQQPGAENNTFMVMHHFHSVSQQITFSQEVKESVNSRMDSLCKFIFKLPRERDETYRALRFEPLLAKLVTHARSQIRVLGNMRKVLEPANEKTTEWLLDLFIQMIETQWGFRVHERDEMGDEDSDRKVAEIQGVLNRNNCTALCIELVATGIKDGIVEKALRLLMALLYKEGGHKSVQARINRLLTKTANIHFFEKAKQVIAEYVLFHENELTNAASPDTAGTADPNYTAGGSRLKDFGDVTALGQIDGASAARLGKDKNSGHDEATAMAASESHAAHKVLDARTVALSLDHSDGLSTLHGTARRPPHMKLVACLQLMCEGHCLSNQNVLREQAAEGVGAGPEPVNLLKNIVDAFIPISMQRNSSGLMSTVELAKLLLEAVQGPCALNQHFIAVDTEFLEATNPLFLLHSHDYTTEAGGEVQEVSVADAAKEKERESQMEESPCPEYCECNTCQLTELKRTLLKIFVGLVEKHRRPSKVYDRIQSVVHLEQLQKFVSPPPVPLDPKMDAMEAMEFLEKQQLERDKPLTPVQGHGLVVIQMLFDYDPQLRNELTIEKDVEERLNRELREIEIVWGEGDEALVVKRRFRMDKLMKYLADATKTQLVQEVERDSQEAKHQDFIRRTQFIVWELRHMKMLDDAGLLIFFNRKTQDQATWVTFFINLAINFTYLGTMKWRDQGCGPSEIEFVNQYGEGPHNGHGDQVCINGMASSILLLFNCSQITLSIFTLVLYVIVRCPAIYNLTKESKER